MQEWIIAMLLISTVLMIRDMAKTILAGRSPKIKELLPMNENHPQKEKVQHYANAFRKLADTLYSMPYRKEYLSEGQLQQIRGEVKEQVCRTCYQREQCWREHRQQLEEKSEQVIRSLEDGKDDLLFELQEEWKGLCCHFVQYLEQIYYGFMKEKQKLLWENQRIETRLSVARQMAEVSALLKQISEDLYDVEETAGPFYQELRKKLKKHHVSLKKLWVMEKQEQHRRIFMTMHSIHGHCISVKEISTVLSELYKCAMIAAPGSRCIVNGEIHTIQFIEDTPYRVLCGMAKLTKENEKVSGDTCLFREMEQGSYLLCISDGMGSGRNANRESEAVVDLIEEFIQADFTQETAARMVNALLVMKNEIEGSSTLDLCTIDLYTGICRMLKAGAAATFIKRDHWVEFIASQSLALGVLQKIDFEKTSRKLYHGEYLIMMTDGVMDALPLEREEETMKEILMEIQDVNPKEISRGILERVLGYSDYKAQDDMTVLVAGIWKK